MNIQHRRPRLSRASILILAVAVCVPVALTAGPALAASTSTKVVVKPPAGAAKPVPGTGMGTQAALGDPRCNTGQQYGVYGRWSTAVVGGGPACVVPLADGAKNGGATAPGVTATSVKVVAVIPSGDRSITQTKAAPPVYVGDNSPSSWENAVHDYLFANKDFYEQWGRSIDVTFYTSTGTDEAAQNADAVAIKAMKPFAVINFDTYGLDTLVTQLAKAKILVNSYSTSPTESSAVAPYRWGAGSDTDAAASNSAEIIGKQLVGKKAEFGGDDVKGQTRKFGLVTIQDYIDLAAFNSALSKYGGKAGVVSPASELSYAANGSAAGDPVIAQQSAPTFVSKMKADGVTTVILFTDRAMNQALMDQADQQDWHPEWFYTGSGYTDFPFLVTALPDDQANHAFGISILPPYIAFPASAQALASPTAAYGWYWGAGVGTYTGLVQAGSDWLLRAIHYAGPDLTAKTVQQGLFSSPPTGGDPNQLLVMLSGYGRTTGLPYDSYNPGAADFVPFWMDPLTTAPSPGTGTVVKHASWYFDNPRRYHGGQWPTSFPWFDKSKSITELSEVPTNLPLPVAAPPCAAQACPATGAAAPKAGAAGSSFSVTPTPGAVPAA